MAASIINIADYRKRKAEAERCESPLSGTACTMLFPMFCGFGWLLVPVMIPVITGGATHA